MKKILLFLSFSVLCLSSCKKEKTTWDSDWSVPLVHGRLTLDDLLDPTYSTTNTDNYLSIIYNEAVYSFNIDTLVQMPDTTIVEKTALAIGITVNPGFALANPTNQVYDLDNIELKKIIAKGGTISLNLKSEWNGNIAMTLDFPKVSKNGIPFLRSYDLPPGTSANPSFGIDAIDMAGYEFDLRGLSGNLWNTLSGDLIVESNETVASFDVSNVDSLVYEISFTDVQLDYAKGYFGTYLLSDTTSFKLPFMNSVLGGTIDIDSIKMNVKVMNGFNLLAQAKISLLRGINSKTNNVVDLSFPQLGASMNINPANGGLYNWSHSEYTFAVNNSNSNVTSFIENLSDSILLGYELNINPFGNITAGNDEIFPGSTMDIVVDAEFPLNFGANDLTLTDTFKFTYTGSSSYTGQGATITLSYENGFPLGANATLYLLDDSNVLIDSIVGSSGIQSGSYNTVTYQTAVTAGNIVYELDASDIANLDLASKFALIVSFTSDGAQKVKIDANAFFDFKLRSNLQISVHL